MAQVITHSYQVSQAPNDLEQPEALLDVFHSLEHLNHIVTDIFQHIDKRLQEEQLRVTEIKKRVGVCQQKVQKIKGSKQAITVFSTAKFPAPKVLPSYPTLFSQEEEVYIFL
jgi:WAS family protein 1